MSVSKEKHRKKSIIDKKIIKQLRNEGFIEKTTNYSHEIKCTFIEIEHKYKEKLKNMTGMTGMTTILC